jgi:hypothetical protein
VRHEPIEGNVAGGQLSLKGGGQQLYDLALSGDRGIGSPLEPYTKRDLVTDLYSSSTSIARYDECNRHISFKQLQEIYDIATRGDQGMGITLGKPSKMDLAVDLYSGLPG